MTAKRYPAGPVTPHGMYFLEQGTHPEMQLTAPDGSIEVALMGGLAIPDYHAAPEVVYLKELKGLIPPTRHIEQKGATQDGITHIDALYEPIPIEAVVECRGRDPQHTRDVVRNLIATLDAKQTSELGFLTQEMGYWWSDVRWHKGAPPDPYTGAQSCRQKLSLRLQADHGFWRTYDHADMFSFTYDDMTDLFDTDYAEGVGPDWPLHYYDGTGGGYPRVRNGNVEWVDDPDDPILTEGRSVMIGPYADFESETDNQVVSIVIGSSQEWTLGDGAENHIWLRVGRNPDGTWNGSGVRCSIGFLGLELSRYHDYAETRMRLAPLGQPIFGGLGIGLALWVPPLPGERYTFIAGFPGAPRKFQVQRNGLPILNFVEPDNMSPIGPANRGVAFGLRAGGALLTQATPATVRAISAGDNAAVAQSGFLTMLNVGDQPMYWDATLFGPGVFKLYDGPGSTDYVKFGPLLPNQIVMLRTDPRSNTTLVQDLTTTPPSPQELDAFRDAITKFLSFAGMDDSALGDQIKSQFGIRAPQGNLYKYLNGRFSDNAAIPPKSPGNPAQPYFLKVEIEGGNADSKVIASGTPLRRYPL